jgi:hypothetical protein
VMVAEAAHPVAPIRGPRSVCSRFGELRIHTTILRLRKRAGEPLLSLQRRLSFRLSPAP